jgi:hypothetical protein
VVRIRDVLRERGASEQEIEGHDAEIVRLRERLAERVRRSVAPDRGRAA